MSERTTTAIVVENKGLAHNAVGTASLTGIGLASTGPAYSLAVSVGLLAVAVGTRAWVALAIAIVPMVLVALCCRELNRSQPDCGTNFTWTSRAFGTTAGWMTGWVSVMACVLVMSNLAQVGAIYTYTLFGFDGLAGSRPAQAFLGSAMIALVVLLARRGVRLAARVQLVLVVAELVALAWFSVEAFRASPLAEVSNGVGSGQPGDWGVALLAAVFLYWGWDSTFAVNEESDEPSRTPGRAALISNVVLLITYITVAYCAVKYAGAQGLAGIGENDFFAILGDQLLGSAGGTILGIAVLVSAIAATQSTVIPAARMLLAMGNAGRLPARFATVSSTTHTPAFATTAFGVVSTVLYLALVSISDAVLADSVAATAVLISLYYLATAAAVPVTFRFEVWSVRNVVMRAVVPVAAILLFVWIFFLAFADLSATSVSVVAIILAIGLAMRLRTRTGGKSPTIMGVRSPRYRPQPDA